MFTLPFILMTLLLPFMCQSFPALDKSLEKKQQQEQLKQEQYACLLRSNESLLNDFQQSVREKHGITDPEYGNELICEGGL